METEANIPRINMIEQAEKEQSIEDVLFNEPFILCFGAEQFPIKRRRWRENRAWRRKVIEHDQNAKQVIFGEIPEGETHARLLAMSDKGIELVLELVWNYIEGQVPREKLEEATEEQILAAYEKLLGVGFPLGTMDAGASIVLRRR